MRRARHPDRPAHPRSLEEILARKRELIERAAGQRQELAAHSAGLLPAFAAGDKAVGVARSILARPLVLAAAGGLLLVLFPRAVLSLATRGFAVWSGVRAARRGISALAR